jgi:hypothetical protein
MDMNDRNRGDHEVAPAAPSPRSRTSRRLSTRWATVVSLPLAGALGVALALPGTTADAASPSPHTDAIEAVQAAGIAEGYPDGSFRPSSGVTRAQMASFLGRALELEPEAGASFPDIAGSTHAGMIDAIATANITTGYPDGTFRPNDTVTRGQMASFLARGFGLISTRTDGSEASDPGVSERACTQVLEPGRRHSPSAGPGDVICLAAGTHGDVKLYDIEGTADDPVIIRNEGGVATIEADGRYAGIQIRNSHHLHISGTGVEAQCGADYAESDQRCGIQVHNSGNGITGKVKTEYVTIDHVEVGHVSSSGVGFHDKDAVRYEWTQHDVAFRDLYIHDIGTEGHYHGASRYPDNGDRHLLDGVEVTRNLVVRTGRDGIQVRSTPWNCTIQDNLIRDTGLNGESNHLYGISLGRGGACDIIGNDIRRAGGDGIGDRGLHGQTIAHNTIVDSGDRGINVREGDQAPDNSETPDYPRSTHVLDNVIDGADRDGIHFGNTDGTDNRIHDNVLRDVTTPIDYGSGATADESGNTTRRPGR